eukprot:1145766-Pelagomonas_calceolata.AAC.3
MSRNRNDAGLIYKLSAPQLIQRPLSVTLLHGPLPWQIRRNRGNKGSKSNAMYPKLPSPRPRPQSGR